MPRAGRVVCAKLESSLSQATDERRVDDKRHARLLTSTATTPDPWSLHCHFHLLLFNVYCRVVRDDGQGGITAG